MVRARDRTLSIAMQGQHKAEQFHLCKDYLVRNVNYRAYVQMVLQIATVEVPLNSI
jgi:hypothetical protein